MASYSISTGELGKISRGISRKDAEIERTRQQAQIGKGVALAVSMGSSFGFGYLRGTQEDPNTGAWNVPNSTVDWQAAATLALASGAFAASYKKETAPYANYLCLAAIGVGCHYFGQLGRKMGRTGKFTTIAGVPGIGALPQYNPASYNPTQFSAPYSDPVASSLASAGV